jgi:hypothetical protein
MSLVVEKVAAFLARQRFGVADDKNFLFIYKNNLVNFFLFLFHFYLYLFYFGFINQ